MTDRGNVVSDERLLEVLDTHEHVVVKTAEVADEIALKQQQTSRRLQALRDKGEIGGRQVGRGYVWWSLDRINAAEE